LREVGIESSDPRIVLAHPAINEACKKLASLAHEHYRRAEGVLHARPRGLLRAPRLMGAVYARILAKMEKVGWAPPRERVRIGRGPLIMIVLPPRPECMSSGIVTIVGAGLSGLSAAVALAAQGIRVEVLEATSAAGGRCRSYYDPQVDQIIDNGNHLILSGTTPSRLFASDRIGGKASPARNIPNLPSPSCRRENAGRSASMTDGCPGGRSTRSAGSRTQTRATISLSPD